VLEEISADLRATISASMLISGSVHIIDIAPMRVGHSELSDKVWSSVHVRLEGILRHRLAPSDFFAPTGPTRYLVVTPRENAEEASIICLRILQELATAVFGDWSADSICIERVQEDAGGGLAAQRLSINAIEHLAQRPAAGQPRHIARPARRLSLHPQLRAGMGCAPRSGYHL